MRLIYRDWVLGETQNNIAAYRMHPWTVAECMRVEIPAQEIRPPVGIPSEDWEALLTHGGFPDADCFSINRPTVVPALTFLSQLV